MTDAREQFLASPWAFYKRFFLDPSKGLLRDYWGFCQSMTGARRGPSGPSEAGDQGTPDHAHDQLREAVEGSRGNSITTAIERYRALPEGAVRQALDVATEVVGDVDTDVYLMPGLATANAMTPTLGGRTVVVICLDQNRGIEDLVMAMAHELSHCALAQATESTPAPAAEPPAGPILGQMMYSEGLAVAASLAALDAYRRKASAPSRVVSRDLRSGAASGTTCSQGSQHSETNLAAALWFAPEVLAWCRSHESSLWAKALPVLKSGDRRDFLYWFAKFTADDWQEDGLPCRAGYYLGYSAVTSLLDRLSIREAHLLPPSERENSLLARARRLGAG